MCFANDLMIFCRAKVVMVSLINHSLDQFWILSSLSPNNNKSSMFLYGVKPDTKMQLLNVLDYKEGKLLVRYLGVPFITKKLTSPNCLILVDHIMAKAKSELIALFYIRLDFSLSNPFSSLFTYTGLLYSFFRRLLL